MGVDTSKLNSNEGIQTLRNGLIQAKSRILRSMRSDAIVWKIKYRDKNFVILGLGAIKEGFEFRNKRFSVWIWMSSGIDLYFGTNISLYRVWISSDRSLNIGVYTL